MLFVFASITVVAKHLLSKVQLLKTDGLTVTMSSSAQAVDQATLESIARNRNRLLRLADNIKVRKKPGSKRTVDLRLDPGYTNIEHLVFGTYRPRTSLPGCSQPPVAAAEVPAQPEPAALLATPPVTRCECSAHSPRRRVPPFGEQQGEAAAGGSNDVAGRVCPLDQQRASRTERPPPAGHAWPQGSSTGGQDAVTVGSDAAAARSHGDMPRSLPVGDIGVTSSKGAQCRREPEKPSSSSCPPAPSEETRIIQVDLQAASRPKVREPAVVYSLEPTGETAGHELRVVSASGVQHASAIPKPRTRKVQLGQQPDALRPRVVVDARARKTQQPPIVVAAPARRQPPTRSSSISARGAQAQVSQTTLPRSRPRAGEERAKPLKNGVKFAEPLQECSNIVAAASGRVSTVLLNGTKATDGVPVGGTSKSSRDSSATALSVAPPCYRSPALPPKSAPLPVPEIVPKPRQPASRRQMPQCQLANLSEDRANAQNGSSPARVPPAYCTISPKPVPRKDVRPADVLPLSPWRGVPHRPEPTSDHSIDALLLADTCISPPGMFKDRKITDQTGCRAPQLTESTLSRWVGNTSRESARLLNELAVFAESQLPCRLNEPQSRSGLAVGASETWFDSLRRDTCEEPSALPSPVRESTSHLLPPPCGGSPRSVTQSACSQSPTIGRASNGKVVVTMRSLSVEEAADDGSGDSTNVSPRLHKSNSGDVAHIVRDPVPNGSPFPPRSPKMVNGGCSLGCAPHERQQDSPRPFKQGQPPPAVGFSPTRSPYRKKCAGQLAATTPSKMWMSDIEERDENSSSSAASRVPVDEYCDLDCTLMQSSSSSTSSSSSSSTISEGNGTSVVVRVASWDQRSSSSPPSPTRSLPSRSPPASFESRPFTVYGSITNGFTWMTKASTDCGSVSRSLPLSHPNGRRDAPAAGNDFVCFRTGRDCGELTSPSPISDPSPRPLIWSESPGTRCRAHPVPCPLTVIQPFVACPHCFPADVCVPPVLARDVTPPHELSGPGVHSSFVPAGPA
ncbi:hypothetical protein HPB48_001828 [Haemaphysalis longicornis]|uniref:Uncharacterized protein n=1 Tax=Haemaphysalis longicornis TaxID=44386 RepID=A0A9J6G4U4_HAELO|nr:hypothetical protein HPB48_001828 [Haemaphysalis longicornis]